LMQPRPAGFLDRESQKEIIAPIAYQTDAHPRRQS
jgi:hypothetical protein